MSFYHAIYNKGEDTTIYGEVQTLLWENPSLNTDFAPQKVTINLSDYDGCIIEFNADTLAKLLGTRVKSGKTRIGAGFTSVNADGSYSRTFNIANDGVTFNAGFSNANVSNGHCIPSKIYGYKQYKDNIVQPVTFNYRLSNQTNASESIMLYTKTTAPLDGYYKRSDIVGFKNATSNLTTEFKQLSAGDEITLSVTKTSGVQEATSMIIYYSKTGE